VDQLWLDLRPIGDARLERAVSPPSGALPGSLALEPPPNADPDWHRRRITGWAGVQHRSQARPQPAGASMPSEEVACTECMVPIAWPAIRLMELPGVLRAKLAG